MNYYQLVSAQGALDELKGKDLTAVPTTQRRNFFQLCIEVAQELEFYGQQERALAEKYGTITPEGTVEFSGNAQHMQAFIDAHKELDTTEIGALPSCTIDNSLVPSITTATMVALAGIIEFFPEEASE